MSQSQSYPGHDVLTVGFLEPTILQYHYFVKSQAALRKKSFSDSSDGTKKNGKFLQGTCFLRRLPVFLNKGD